jgi:hypothetical protein
MEMCAVKMCFAGCLLVFLASSANAQPWSEGFEQGLGGARPYLEDPPNAQLEVAADHPAEGRQFIRAILPGKGPLEGFNLTAAGLRGGRLATVTAQVRGQGEVWLCLISGNGWLYSPQTLPLTDQWQEVSLRKVLLERDTTLGIHFLSRTVQQSAVFEVDEVKVTLATPPQVYDAEVGPWRCEAEDFVLRRAYVAEDQTASGGRAARHGEYVALVGLPFPRTRRPVTVYLRVKPGSEREEYRLNTTQGGNTQSLSRIKPEKAFWSAEASASARRQRPTHSRKVAFWSAEASASARRQRPTHSRKAGKWQWLRFPPATTGEVGDSFGAAETGRPGG